MVISGSISLPIPVLACQSPSRPPPAPWRAFPKSLPLARNLRTVIPDMRHASPTLAAVPIREGHSPRPSLLRRLWRALSLGKGAPVAAPLVYDAEDIEEANRISDALCRQHAR